MLARHRCNKAVTPAGVVGDVAPASAAIAKRLAQRRDMDPERTVVDDRIGPGAGDQLVLVDRLAGAFDERNQNIQRAAAEAQWFPVIEQYSLRRDQPERSEGEGLFIHRENRPWERLLIQNTRPLATRSGSIGSRSRNRAPRETGKELDASAAWLIGQGQSLQQAFRLF